MGAGSVPDVRDLQQHHDAVAAPVMDQPFGLTLGAQSRNGGSSSPKLPSAASSSSMSWATRPEARGAPVFMGASLFVTQARAAANSSELAPVARISATR